MKMETFPILEIGDNGLFVYIMQAALKYRGYSVSINGAFEMSTFAALKAFRREHYLDGDTICDESTWKALFNY